MSMNIGGMNPSINGNSQLGSGYTVEDLLKDPKLLEQLNGQTVRINGVDYAVEDGEVKPADEAGDTSIFGSDEDGEVGDTVDFSGSNGINGAERVATTPEGQAILDEINELEEKKDANTEEIEAIKAEIETLTAEAEDEINQALAAQEQAVADHKDATNKLVKDSLANYIAANEEGGEGMTRDELQASIKQGAQDLGLPAEIGDATAMLMSASEKLDEVDGLLGDLNGLILENQSLESQINGKCTEFDAVEEAAKKAEEEKKKCCDPIGFEATDKDGNKAQYDFIKDDGNFDSTDDFLGAQNQWQEMAALCRHTPLPIALDEELIGTSPDILDTIRPQAIVIKPSLHGGLLAAQDWAKKADSMGIRWWVNSALESQVGLTALTEWCAFAAPGTMQGLGKGNLFTNDAPGPVRLEGNQLKMQQI